MADQNASTRDWTVIGLGALTAAIGIYCVLVGLGLAPAPSRGEADAPGWIGLLVGLVFSASGCAVIVRGVARADDKSGDLPADTPRWLATIYLLLGLLAASGLAATATWIAFGAGTRHFMLTGPIGVSIGDTIGRTAFGIGAVMSWLIVVLMARTGAKKIFGGKN